MINIDFPFHFDQRGQTSTTDQDDHIRDLIEQFLFTSPGERVNRPDFGSGLSGLVFEPNGPELTAALQQIIQAGLQSWLSDLIEVQALEINHEDAKLHILVQYLVWRTGEQHIERFDRSGV